MKSGKNLDGEDRILWDIVRRTIVPRHKHYTSSDSNDFANLLAQDAGKKVAKQQDNGKKIKHIAPEYSEAVKKPHYPMHIFDRPTHRKIAKGRVSIDGRLDLHGLTQEKAYGLLLHFLQMASNNGFRHVLVITGKGRSLGSDGILRQIVPHWLSTLPFRGFVSAYEDAALHHGGYGALYIRLRRNFSGLYK